MSMIRRAVVGAAVLGAGLASTAGVASAAPSVPGVNGAIAAADAAAQAGTQAGLAGAQAGLSAANAAATVAKNVAGVDIPGLDAVPPFQSVSDIPGLSQGLDAIPSASDLTDLSSLTDLSDPEAFSELLTEGLPTAEDLSEGLSPEDLTPDLSALDALSGS
ncbi:hypothetical protein WCD74_07860 [Actinomycetospora sp. OC33-EN08]|uniref:ATP-binding protein n=1 Tax=Actinomycetospora aurantiaca TaxID=3129233 RepID=A0ABU8ML27_9PSEU